ncbi:uncharacterized protein LOC135488600 [Lineus longissimus]|uniref:uncharacterized protein LOC135488600 n=1 Tax=Lineus longissimus TaxID=88925 RepID=UPI00315D797E
MSLSHNYIFGIHQKVTHGNTKFIQAYGYRITSLRRITDWSLSLALTYVSAEYYEKPSAGHSQTFLDRVSRRSDSLKDSNMWFKSTICVLLVVWVGNGFALPLDLRNENALVSSSSSTDSIEDLDISSLRNRVTDIMAGIKEVQELKENLSDKLKESGLAESDPGFQEYLENLNVELTNQIEDYLKEFERIKSQIAELLKKEVADTPKGPELTSDDASSATSSQMDNAADDRERQFRFPPFPTVSNNDVTNYQTKDHVLAGFISLVGDCPGIEKDIIKIPKSGDLYDLGVDSLREECARVCRHFDECKAFLFVPTFYDGAPYCILKRDSCLNGLAHSDDDFLEFYRKDVAPDVVIGDRSVEVAQDNGKEAAAKKLSRRPTAVPGTSTVLADLEDRVTDLVKKIEVVKEIMEEVTTKLQTVDEKDTNQRDFLEKIEKKLANKMQGYFQMIAQYRGEMAEIINNGGIKDTGGIEDTDLPRGPEPTSRD